MRSQLRGESLAVKGIGHLLSLLRARRIMTTPLPLVCIFGFNFRFVFVFSRIIIILTVCFGLGISFQ